MRTLRGKCPEVTRIAGDSEGQISLTTTGQQRNTGQTLRGETFICLPVILVSIFPTFETVLPSVNVLFSSVLLTCSGNEGGGMSRRECS